MKNMAVPGMVLLMICLGWAYAMTEADVVLIDHNFAFRKGIMKGVQVEAITVKGTVKNVGSSDAKDVRIRVDCRGCYAQFSSDSSPDQWGQTTEYHTIRYVCAGEKETFQFVVTARRRGNLEPTVPEGIRLQVEDWQSKDSE